MNRALPCSAPPILITLLCPAHPEHPDNPDHSDTLITMITLTLPSPMLLFKRLFAAVQEERRSLRQRRAKRQWSLGV